MAIPFDTMVIGDALDSAGFEAFKTVEGVGLNTFGYLWPIEGIWYPGVDIPNTIWVNADDAIGGGSINT